MKIGNLNKDTDYQLACIVCGSKNGLHNKAYRNGDGSITGYVISCEKCDVQDKQFGIWDEESGKAII